MAERFRDRVAIVTGGVSGIGAEITRRLVSEGAKVLAIDINAELVNTASEVFGSSVIGHIADVTDPAAFGGAVTRAVEEFGSVDMLFNVAGGSRPAPLLDIELDSWEFQLRLNLNSVLIGTQVVGRQFIAQGTPGVIVNIASNNSYVPMPFGAAYCAAKAGAVMLTEVAALELADHGIRVNAVSPGLVDTPLTAIFTQTPPIRAAFDEKIAMRRPAQPAEIAAAATFLASDDASYMTGQNITVDGGWSTTAYPDLRKFVPQS